MYPNKDPKILQKTVVMLMPKAYSNLRPTLIERLLNTYGSHLPLETVFHAVHILDQYYYSISRFDHSDSGSCHYGTDQFATLGAVAISIAIKYESRGVSYGKTPIPPHPNQGEMSSRLAEHIERNMLNCVGANLGWRGPISFLERLIKNDRKGESIRLVAEYYLQVVVMSGYFVCLPSALQASIALRTAQTLSNISWSDENEITSGYSHAQLVQHVKDLEQVSKQMGR
ncbi:hypothetical protein V8C42DRAFT_337815 [Trichoderma barbatum]